MTKETSIHEKYFLKTSRLGFRHWHENDFDIALGLWGDYKVTKYFDSRGRLSRGEVKERLQQEIMNQKGHGVQYWPIFLLKSHVHVGCCGLRPYDLSLQIYEIGFHIRSTLWRHGYGREAATAIIAYAFSRLDAKALFAGHNPENEASRYLLGQLGFCYTHDEFYPPTGLNHPSYQLKINYLSHQIS